MKISNYMNNTNSIMEKNTDKVQKGNSQTNEKHTVGQSVKLSISNEGLEYYRNRIQQSGQEKYDDVVQRKELLASKKISDIDYSYEIQKKAAQQNQNVDTGKSALNITDKANNYVKAYAELYDEIVKGYENGTREIYVADEKGPRKLTKDEELSNLDAAYKKTVDDFVTMETTNQHARGIIGEEMKKEIYTLIIKSVLAICITAVTITVLPKSSVIDNTKSIDVFSPAQIVSSIKNKRSNKNSTTKKTTKSKENNESTVSEQQVSSDITAVPSDIQELMDKAQKNLSKEKKIGKTTEEAYFGGGTLVKSGNIELQSKIPENFYKVDADKLLEQKADLKIKDASKPTVLIYHTHTTESYSLLDVGYYTGSLDTRSKKADRNMVRVGDDLCKYLNDLGINTIHDTEIHDEDYTGAYKHSRKSVLKYLEKYPTIDITIDVHRDDITYQNKTKVKPTATIAGKKAARMMIIAGAEYGSVENYPTWEYNLRFDLAVQNKVNNMYPSLMRPILFAERKYNMDVTHNSFLLEIGTDANTLDEATYSARLFATALAQLLKDDYIEK